MHDGGESRSKNRFRRSSDEPALVVVYESTASHGECGIKPWNVKKMKRPRQDAVLLSEFERRDQDSHDDNHVMDFEEMAKELEDSDAEDGGADGGDGWGLSGAFYSGRKARLSHFNKGAYRGHVRRKRDASRRRDRAIEIAVFVDDVVYDNERDAGASDPVAVIQDIVFTYLNSVQLLYNSEKLSTQFRLILMRLEIFQRDISGLDKNDGDIEPYLDSFCKWQKDENSHGRDAIQCTVMSFTAMTQKEHLWQVCQAGPAVFARQ